MASEISRAFSLPQERVGAIVKSLPIVRERTPEVAGCASQLGFRALKKTSPGTRPGLRGLTEKSGAGYLHCVGTYLGRTVPRAAGAAIAGTVFAMVLALADAQPQSMLPC